MTVEEYLKLLGTTMEEMADIQEAIEHGEIEEL